MKYFSEKTHKMYDDEAALKLAEKEFDLKAAKEVALREERTARAKEVEDLYREVSRKKKEADEALQRFCKDYGSFHTSVSEVADNCSLFDLFWNNLLF